MASRFSQLFIMPSQDLHLHSDSSSLSMAMADHTGKRKSLRTKLLNLFSSRKSRPTSISSSLRPKLHKDKRKSKDLAGTIIVSPFAQNEHPATISPTSLPAPNQKARSVHSKRDSMFSSISSLSFHTAKQSISSLPRSSSSSLPHSSPVDIPTIRINILGLEKLQSSLRRIERGLQKQESITDNLSRNVAFLMLRKERSVQGNRRLKEGQKRELVAFMGKLRELVGQCFLRKAVFLQRSFQSKQQILSQLAAIPKDGGDGEVLEAKVDVEGIAASLALLKEDLGIQKGLNNALRDGIVGPAQDLRFPNSGNERLAMGRFVGFVEDRLVALDTVYGKLGELVDGIEGLVGGLEKVG